MKLSFAKLPTPVEFLSRLSKQYGRNIYVKRDDMTEFISSGNKIRKLEFLLADALRKNCDVVFTCGGIQSNHARATAHMAVKLGLKPVLFLRENPPDLLDNKMQSVFKTDEAMHSNGNFLLCKLLGAEIVIVNSKDYARIEEVYEEYKKHYEKKSHRVYTIPVGGSNSLGAMGYLFAASEMASQIDLNEVDAVYCAVGSGGTYAGLLSGFRYMGYKTKVIGINVTKTSREEFTNTVFEIIKGMKQYGIDTCVDREEIKIIDDFSGPAYAIPSESDIKCIKYVACKEGIILDPVYTAKAFRGMLEISKENQTVLFIHTGGIFGLFAQAAKFTEA